MSSYYELGTILSALNCFNPPRHLLIYIYTIIWIIQCKNIWYVPVLYIRSTKTLTILLLSSFQLLLFSKVVQDNQYSSFCLFWQDCYFFYHDDIDTLCQSPSCSIYHNRIFPLNRCLLVTKTYQNEKNFWVGI